MYEFAHEGIHHKTVFEAIMHVLSQWIMIGIASVIIAFGLMWLLSRRKTVRIEKEDK